MQIQCPTVWIEVLGMLSKEWGIPLNEVRCELLHHYTAFPRGRVYKRTIKRGPFEEQVVPGAEAKVRQMFHLGPHPKVQVDSHWNPKQSDYEKALEFLEKVGAERMNRGCDLRFEYSTDPEMLPNLVKLFIRESLEYGNLSRGEIDHLGRKMILDSDGQLWFREAVEISKVEPDQVPSEPQILRWMESVYFS